MAFCLPMGFRIRLGAVQVGIVLPSTVRHVAFFEVTREVQPTLPARRMDCYILLGAVIPNMVNTFFMVSRTAIQS